jgi:hypothetical protein
MLESEANSVRESHRTIVDLFLDAADFRQADGLSERRQAS